MRLGINDDNVRVLVVTVEDISFRTRGKAKKINLLSPIEVEVCQLCAL